MREDVQSQVVKALADVSDKEIAVEDVTPTMKLREDLELDSLGALTLIMDMEDEFGISITEEEIMKLDTVNDVVSAIIERLPQEQQVV